MHFCCNEMAHINRWGPMGLLRTTTKQLLTILPSDERGDGEGGGGSLDFVMKARKNARSWTRKT